MGKNCSFWVQHDCLTLRTSRTLTFSSTNKKLTHKQDNILTNKRRELDSQRSIKEKEEERSIFGKL